MISGRLCKAFVWNRVISLLLSWHDRALRSDSSAVGSIAWGHRLEYRGSVAAKDTAGNDWVLISAGAPDKRGLSYPLEGVIAGVGLQGTFRLTPTHIKRVTLHSWSTGEAWDLFPERHQVARPTSDVQRLGGVEQEWEIADRALRLPENLSAARNAGCPCGSGVKFKRCHGREW
jgi:hypothetical protein